MTKKHFEAMADYCAETRKLATLAVIEDEPPRIIEEMKARAAAHYEFALYLCNKFGERFDRARFDAWIEKKARKA